MDDIDKKIIDVLKDNARWSTQKIAKKTGIPITTVHYRIKKLEGEGIIKKYTVGLDYKKMGVPICAFVLIVVDYNDMKEKNLTQHQLAQKLLLKPQVEAASMVAGRFDIIVKLRVANVDELNQFVTVDMRNMQGVERTETMLVLNDLQ